MAAMVSKTSQAQEVSAATPSTRSTRAKEAYETGKVAFDAGKFNVALDAFQEAYDLERRSQLLFNIASAYDRLDQAAKAVDHYEAYLEANPDAANAPYVASRLRLLRPKVEEARRKRDAEGAKRKQLQEAQLAAARVAVEDTNATVEIRANKGPSRVPSIILWSVAGAAAIGAAIAGPLALEKRGELNAACDANRRCDASLRDDTDSLATLSLLTDVMLGSALLFGVAGAVWWLTSPEEESIPAVSAACSGEGCVASWRQAF